MPRFLFVPFVLVITLPCASTRGQAVTERPAGQQPTQQTSAQSAPSAQPTAATEKPPLPNIAALMREVENREYTAESKEKDYIYKETSTFDALDGKGAVKRTESREFEIFWLNGVRVARLLKKDDKELSPDEKKKEDERIDKEVAKAQERREKAVAEGHDPASGGQDEISFARILELGTASNARRESIGGRDTILVDFAGDPRAKTHNELEAAFKDLAGTVWIDEQDKVIERVDARFVNNFRVGAGLVADIRKDTWFKVNFVKVNDEVWFPAVVEGNGHARILLFFSLEGNYHGHTSDYRKFKATSKIVPNSAPPELPPHSP